MFGSVSQWFYQWIGGIQPAPDAVGFDRIILRPALVQGLDWAQARYDSIRGPIVCRWERAPGQVKLEIQIPANAIATLYLPAASADRLAEGGRPVVQANGVQQVRATPSALVCELGAGNYSFSLSEPKR